MPTHLDAGAFHELLKAFLAEDAAGGDVTTSSIVSNAKRARGEVLAKSQLVLAGMELFIEVFRLLDASTEADIFLHDGDELSPGQIPAKVSAAARALLSGERVALNLLQRLSGVATITQRFVRAVEGTGAQIVDTRKTTPGLRALEKYAVRTGGGQSHRKDLAEAILIKENHIRMAGGVAPALEAARTAKNRVKWMEIEVTNLEELCATLPYSPDIILLDNMSPQLVRQAVELVKSRESTRDIRTEASGGITLANVREFAEAGVDWISVGALTHSAPAMDLSFEIEPVD